LELCDSAKLGQFQDEYAVRADTAGRRYDDSAFFNGR
jgi:hypothetical protein